MKVAGNVKKVSGGKEDPWALRVVRLMYSKLAFCIHKPWPKSLGTTVPSGGSPRVEACSAVFAAQVLSDRYSHSGDSLIRGSLSLKPL